MSLCYIISNNQKTHRKDVHDMNKFDELLAALQKREDEKRKNTLLWILAVIGAVAAVAAIAYAVYRHFSPDYLEDFEDDFDDDFEDFFEDDDFPEMDEEKAAAKESAPETSEEEKEEEGKKARELLRYLENHRKELLPYDRRGIKIPEAKEGIVYKHMGVQENQNCTVITMRMKHRRMRWSEKGANNLAKALYRKENRELISTIERYTDGLIFTMRMREIIETLSAAKAPKKDGKGNIYIELMNRHMPILDALQTAARKEFRRIFIG